MPPNKTTPKTAAPPGTANRRVENKRQSKSPPARKKPVRGKRHAQAIVYDGATPLPDSQHEAFAQNLFDQGASLNITEAYQRAFPDSKRGSARRSGSRLLLTKNDILLRVEFLKNQVASERVATKQEIAEAYTSILRARHSDFLSDSADGVWFHDIGPETLNQAALKKVRTRIQTIKGSDETVIEKQFDEIELESKITAGKALSELMGYNAPRKATISDERHDDAVQPLAQLIAQIQASPEPLLDS